MPDVLALGLARLDALGLAPALPEAGRAEELAAFTLQGGGPASTAACVLAGLGHDVAFAGKVGDDGHGRFVREALVEAGVDVRGLLTEAGGITPFSFTLVERGSGRRTTSFTRGNVSVLAAEQLLTALLDGARALVVDGSQPAAQELAARLARSRRIPVILDAGGTRAELTELCRLADHVVASERFARELGGTTGKSLKALRALGPGCAVVTLGEDGCVGQDGEGEPVQVPALPGDVVDSTGAGDVFLGGYVHGLLTGQPLRRRLELAAAAAGISCRELGPRAALPTRAELEAALS